MTAITVSHPKNHEACVNRGIELLQKSDSFLVIALHNNQVNGVASVASSEQDRMIAIGIRKFIDQRELEIERIKTEANNETH